MRDNKELTFDGVLFQRIDYNILETKSNLSDNQLEFRKIWMSNTN